MTAWRHSPRRESGPDLRPLFRASFDQIATAHLWLTRLPVAGLLPRELPVLAHAAWAFPLVGLSVGAIGAATAMGASWAGLSAPVAALLVIGAMLMTTGALHEDGLADFADAAGGGSREARLEIMRDSRIGSYGVLALLIVTGLRIACIAALFAISPALAAAGVIGAAAASRAGMAVAMAALGPARPDGLGRQAGRVGAACAATAAGLGGAALLIPAMMLPHPALVWLACAGAIAGAQLWIGARARRLLGGQTGDVLGALQQAGEAACLVALSVFL